MVSIQEVNDREQWDKYIIAAGGHPLQLWGWGEVKRAHNWQAQRVFVVDEKGKRLGAAQILFRKLPWPLRSFSYVPRGPLASETDRASVLAALRTHVKSANKSCVLSIEPQWEKVTRMKGWRRTSNTILVPRTVILDLTSTEEQLLAVMAKKTRQYIRKSDKETTVIRTVKSREELAKCLVIYKQTASRAGFALHGDDYYEMIFDELGERSPVFASFVNEEPVAFVWLAVTAAVAFELYGGMNETGQSLRANYALKWHAITTLKQQGIAEYDMNGLLNDGVSTFKRGFTNRDSQLIGAYDAPLSIFYPLWAYGLPLAKKIVRIVKRS